MTTSDDKMGGSSFYGDLHTHPKVRKISNVPISGVLKPECDPPFNIRCPHSRLGKERRASLFVTSLSVIIREHEYAGAATTVPHMCVHIIFHISIPKSSEFQIPLEITTYTSDHDPKILWNLTSLFSHQNTINFLIPKLLTS